MRKPAQPKDQRPAPGDELTKPALMQVVRRKIGVAAPGSAKSAAGAAATAAPSAVVPPTPLAAHPADSSKTSTAEAKSSVNESVVEVGGWESTSSADTINTAVTEVSAKKTAHALK